MINKKKSRYLVLLTVSIFFSAFNSFVVAQVYKIIPASSSMTIFGTTNVHDFQSKVGQISGEVVINASKQVQSLSVDVPVKGIKSNEKAMDNKTYEAFKSDKNPNISFRLIEVGSRKHPKQSKKYFQRSANEHKTITQVDDRRK